MSEELIGYLCTVISVIGFGSNYIPVKKVDVKDGVFFTFCMAFGVLLVGIIQWAAFGFYKFEPFAVLGGIILAVANACIPLIIQSCGLGIGQLVWGVTCMLTGWATGTFGLFGKHKDQVEYFGLNCTGVLIALLSLAPFTLMESKAPCQAPAAAPEDNISIVSADGSEFGIVTESVQESDTHELGEHSQSSEAAPSSTNFTPGFGLALIVGVLIGSNFSPPTYLQQIGPPEHSSDPMHYIISHFSGLFATTLLYVIVYMGVMGDKAYCGNEIIVPGILSGIVWGVAQVGWFKANTVLSYVIAFPIIVAVPGVLAAIWGVVLFGENRGARNMKLLLLVILLQAVGVALIAVSKGNPKL